MAEVEPGCLQVVGLREPTFPSSGQGPGMQITVYYGEEDHCLIRLLDQEARRQRKSRSAVVLSILEEHFEREKRIGEILLERGWVDERALSRALLIQDRYRQS